MSALEGASEWGAHRTNTVPRLTERTDLPMLKAFGVLSSPQLGQGDHSDQQVFTASSGNYTTHRAWFLDVLKGKNVILCRTSALECHADDAPFLRLIAECVIETQKDYCRLLRLPTRDEIEGGMSRA